MKHYDDLQRFKDKTRTGAINFKDMSAQTQTADSGRWAIIKQLNQNPDDDNALSHADSVSVPAPQSVKADEFDIRHAKPAPAPVIASPAAGQSTIMASVASSVASTPVEPAAIPEPAVRPQPAAPTLFEQLSPAPAAQPRAPAPVPPPSPPPRQQAEAVPFNKLFAAKAAPAATHAGKDLPLQPLLEMIASCH